ncbi:MAG: beta-lactamase family protein [Bacteroidetes bacterium]|nr:beta-lactamase family protein [Bacteroidota bacterium]
MKKQENSTWTMGFDTPSQPLSSSGNYFSDKSVGHLGFTGTSLWIDLAQKVIIVLLTNRVISGMEKTEIQLFRPQVHNIIMEDLVEIG